MRFLSSLVVAGLLPTLSLASVANSAYYRNFTNAGGAGTVFAVNLPENSTDVHFTIITPALSWIGLGVGTMNNSAMMVLYSSKSNSSRPTLSSRVSKGDGEPTVTKAYNFSLSDDSSVFQNAGVYKMWRANINCVGCRDSLKDVLNTSATMQSFVYAVGSEKQVVSDAVDAKLEGLWTSDVFYLDMPRATGEGGYPDFDVQGLAWNETQFQGGGEFPIVPDIGRPTKLHGGFMTFAVLIVMPINIALITIWKSAALHLVNCFIFAVVYMTGFALGVKDSISYQDKRFNSPHQVLGILTTAVLLLISVAAYMPRLSRTDPASVARKIHSHVSGVTWILTIITGGLGFQLSKAGWGAISVYIALLVVATMGLGAVLLFAYFRRGVKGIAKLNDHGDEVEMHIRGIQQIQEERGHPNPPPQYT